MSRLLVLLSVAAVLSGCSSSTTQYDVGGFYTNGNVGLGVYSDGKFMAWTEAMGTKGYEGTWRIQGDKVKIHLTFDISYKPGDDMDYLWYQIENGGDTLVSQSGKYRYTRTKR